MMATVNKMVILNANELASNTKKAYSNKKAIVVANVMAETNKTTSNIKKAYVNVMASNNGNNTKRAYINKAVTINKDNIGRPHINIVAIADTIMMAKRKGDVNIATTANITASNAKEGANIAMIANANKKASNIKKRMRNYQQTQMPT